MSFLWGLLSNFARFDMSDFAMLNACRLSIEASALFQRAHAAALFSSYPSRGCGSNIYSGNGRDLRLGRSRTAEEKNADRLVCPVLQALDYIAKRAVHRAAFVCNALDMGPGVGVDPQWALRAMCASSWSLVEADAIQNWSMIRARRADTTVVLARHGPGKPEVCPRAAPKGAAAAYWQELH